MHGEGGQGSVEAALCIPVVFLLLLLLVQPGILLYDRMVMSNAAAEGCRLLATATDAFGSMEGTCEAFVRHRLASVPPIDCFRVRRGEDSWRITMAGGERAASVSVRIAVEVRPLPLLDAAAALVGMANERGNIEVTVEQSALTQPAWAQAAASAPPSDWVGAWAR